MSKISESTLEELQHLQKVELHVHLEGSIRPETVLHLAKKNQVDLPAQTLGELQDWYRFRDFPHFVQVYVGVTKCIKDPSDIEFVAKQFFEGQAAQNITYSEATYTASTVESHCGIPFDEQMEALQRARTWAQNELGVTGNFILDIVRGQRPDEAIKTVEWVAKALGNGVCALGIAGFESRGTKQYADVFREAQKLKLPVTAHAGETEGAWSIWETLEITGCTRIGHGVRALESPELISHLVKHEVLLEICPSSNVCLGVVPSFAEHPIQKLREAGVKVCVNSDDPPMFGTTLTDELRMGMETFGWEFEEIQTMLNAANTARFA